MLANGQQVSFTTFYAVQTTAAKGLENVMHVAH
jgi:hypothetical protein